MKKNDLLKAMALALILCCSMVSLTAQTGFDLQGHRGCRGLMPENTIPAFLKAVQLGVNTLEMDVVITKDDQVLVSHEPYMNSVTCLDSTGERIPAARQKDIRIFDLTAAQISRFDCGSLPHPDFPEQLKMKVSKPLLSAVIDSVESFIQLNGLAPVRYNIEIKSSEEGDNRMHPDIESFSERVVGVIREKGIAGRATIQSFDFRPLRYLHARHPDLGLAVLISNVNSLSTNIDKLGFTPAVYSPYYRLVTRKTIRQAHERGMKVIPWTVNTTDDMEKMRRLGVDGLITDYPDRR